VGAEDEVGTPAQDLVKLHNVTTVKDKKGDLVVMNRSGA
jgi:hypothetical protein